MSAGEAEVGNPDAAQDLYGLGVRIGFYLQALGMLLYTYSDKKNSDKNDGGNQSGGNQSGGTSNYEQSMRKKNYGQGLKLASGSVTVSILATWFGFAARGLFSPSEAVIVLLILTSLSFPAKTTLSNPRTIVGEMVGLTALLVVELGTCSALLWTFARLVNSLPVLGTGNVVFFFAKVALDGWFRYLALVYCAIDAATSIWFARRVILVTAIAWRHYKSGTEPKEQELKSIEKIMGRKGTEKSIQYFAWLLWTLEVVAVELTIYWNNLSPSRDLQTPGQLMPLITGSIIFIDSGLIAGRDILPRCMQPLFQFILLMNSITLAPTWRGIRRLAGFSESHSGNEVALDPQHRARR